MTVTPVEVAVALGRPAPDEDGTEAAQWQMWIDDALLLIDARLGDPAALNQARLDYVVREAVVAQVRRPDDATSVEIAVDDGREARRYTSSRGRVYIRDEWWDLLSPSAGPSGAFAVDTVATTGSTHADICTLNFGGTYCSCGAVLTGLYALYERSY